MRYSHYNTYPIPTAASRNHGAVTRIRCGDRVSVVMTVPHRVETKHSPRFANDVALALREKIAAGMDFRVANRL